MEPIAENPDNLDRAETDAGPGAAILATLGIRWHPALDITRDLCHCPLASFYIHYIHSVPNQGAGYCLHSWMHCGSIQTEMDPHE